MVKTIAINGKATGGSKTTYLMVLGGDKIVLVDPATGKSPKHISKKMIGRDLHLFEDGLSEPTAVLVDYAMCENSVQIQGIGESGEYHEYLVSSPNDLNLSSSPIPKAEPKVDSGISWGSIGLGILAAGGIAVAAGGGGGGSDNPSSTTQTSVLIDDILIGVDYYLNGSTTKSGTTNSSGEFSYNVGDVITFKVGNATLGSFTPTAGDAVVTIRDLAGGDTTKTKNLAQFLQTLDGDTNDATITISSAKAATIATAGNVQDDPTVGGQVTITVTNPDLGALEDTTAPQATISLSDSFLNQGETATVTVTFTEAVSGFSKDDVTVQNGTIGDFSTADGGVTWTATFTPKGNTTNDVNSITLASSYIDRAGNSGTSAVSPNYTVATTTAPVSAPVLTITDDESGVGNIAGESITYTFTFDQSVTGFTADDVTVTNGTKGAFSGSEGTYTLAVTPTAGFEGNVLVSVEQGAALNSGSAQSTAASSSQSVDMLAPTSLTLTLGADTGLDMTDNVTSNATVNVGGIEAGATWEYSLNNGETWISGTGTSFSLANNTDYKIEAIQVRQSDAVGNISTVAKNSELITIDTKGPKLTITDNEPNLTANMDGSNADGTIDGDGAEILYTFTFDEAVYDFDFSDVILSHGVYGTFTKVSDYKYTLGVTPEAGYQGEMSVSVANTTYHDKAGNQGNVASDTLSIQSVDMRAPEFSSAVADESSNTIVFTFDSVLNAVNKPAVSDFILEVNSVSITTDNLLSIGISDTDATDGANNLTLFVKDGIINSGDSVRAIYNDNVGDVTNAIQDLAGNDSVSFQYIGTAVL